MRESSTDLCVRAYARLVRGAWQGGGQMAAQGVQWFFRLNSFPLVRLFGKEGILDGREFEKTCAFYFGACVCVRSMRVCVALRLPRLGHIVVPKACFHPLHTHTRSFMHSSNTHTHTHTYIHEHRGRDLR
jgi:hypothetical protein